MSKKNKIIIISVFAVVAVIAIIAVSVILVSRSDKKIDYDDSVEFAVPKGSSDFYYSHLSENQKVMYRMILREAEDILYNGVEKTTLGIYYFSDYGLDKESAIETWFAFRYDMPSIFLISNSYKDTLDSIEVTIAPEFLNKQTREKVLKAVDASVEKVGEKIKEEYNDSLKFKIIYDFVMSETDYKSDAQGNDVYDGYSYSIAGALDGDVGTASICQGYAKAISYLCNIYGIECIYVGSESQKHALNIVKIGDYWYYADATLEDNTKSATYKYFLNTYDAYWNKLIKNGKDEIRNNLLSKLPRLDTGMLIINKHLLLSDGSVNYSMLNKTKCSVVGFPEKVKGAVIKTQIADMQVSEIEENIFKDSDVAWIYVPKGIAKIDSKAFSGSGDVAIFFESDVLPYRVDIYYMSYVLNCKDVGMTENGIKWALTGDGTVTLAGYDRDSVELEIPSKINGYDVTAITGYAFYGQNRLMKIEIPKSITRIDSNAFLGCGRLTFYCQTEQKPTGWNNYWKDKNSPVIWNCLNNDTADDGNIYFIADNGVRYALKDGEAILTKQNLNLGIEIIIPREINYKDIAYTVTGIASEAFKSCLNLKKIVIPKSVDYIGKDAFFVYNSIICCEAEAKPQGWDDKWRSEYNYGKVVWDCINNDIADDGNLYYLSTNGILYLLKDGEATVANNQSSLISGEVIIPDEIEYKNAKYKVTKIKSLAFQNCKMTRIKISKYVTSIGFNAFVNCKDLISVIIPISVEYIEGGAFFNNGEDFTIYCEAENKPSGWDERWNTFDIPVVWNYKES